MSSPVSLIPSVSLNPLPSKKWGGQRSSFLSAARPARASQALHAGTVDAGDSGSLSCVTRPSLMRILDSTQHREPDVDRVPAITRSNKKPQLHECDVSHGVLFPFSSSAETLNLTRFLEEMVFGSAVFLQIPSLQTRKTRLKRLQCRDSVSAPFCALETAL